MRMSDHIKQLVVHSKCTISAKLIILDISLIFLTLNDINQLI